MSAQPSAISARFGLSSPFALRRVPTFVRLHSAKHLGQLSPTSGTARHDLRDFSGLQKLLDQAIHFLHARPAATRNALLPAAVDQRMVASFTRGHGIDHGRDPLHFFFRQAAIRQIFQFLSTRQHAQNLLKRP